MRAGAAAAALVVIAEMRLVRPAAVAVLTTDSGTLSRSRNQDLSESKRRRVRTHVRTVGTTWTIL